MALLAEHDRQAVQERLKALSGPVKLVNFTQELACPGCRETTQLLTEISQLSDKITLETHSFAIDREKVEQYGIDKVPATIVEGAKDLGIRFYGLPAGFEFATLLEDMLAVSTGEHGLSPQTVEKLARIEKPVHLQVLVTPT